MNKKFIRIASAQPGCISGALVMVEIDISQGLHAFSIVGLPDKAVEESRDRVSSAIKNCGFTSPKSTNHKIIVSLAPAELRKEGPFFDVPIALAYLSVTGVISADLAEKLFVGELSLDGTIKPIRGALSIAAEAARRGYKEVFVPKENAKEAALVDKVAIFGVGHLSELITHFDLRKKSSLLETQKPSMHERDSALFLGPDFSDIRGQETAKRGLLIAAAGGHNVAMVGPPGTGKTMLAKACKNILPELNRQEMLEVTSIHSYAGTLGKNVMTTPPFRSPHHTSSHVAIIGGGASPQPGEITLAHKGILFLDEFPEFDKRVVEALRQPLEDHEVTIARAKARARYPAQFMLIAALNPCPCGFLGARHRACTCTRHDINRYRRKLSGPIIDRIDVWLTVEHIEYEKLSNKKSSPVSMTPVLRAIIRNLREKSPVANATLSAKDIEGLEVEDRAYEILNTSAHELTLSPRAYHRTLKVAKTIADLEGSAAILHTHILEALTYRPRSLYNAQP